jgi:uncharacterized membrane protein HdeD (DUF308 family)
MEPLTPSESRALVREVSTVWWVVLIVGLLFLGFGIVMLFDVAAGATAVAIIVGAFLIFDGMVEVATAGRNGGSRALGILLGIILVMGGVVAIVWPGVTILVIAVIWGITILVGGLARVIGAAMLRGEGWGWVVAIGVVEAIVGIAALVWPDVTAYVVLILIGLYAIVAGIVQIMLAFALRRAGHVAAAG